MAEPRRDIKPVRQGEHQNPVSRFGDQVHRGNSLGEPLCGRRMRSLFYTFAPVNCPVCLGLRSNHDTGGGKPRRP